VLATPLFFPRNDSDSECIDKGYAHDLGQIYGRKNENTPNDIQMAGDGS